MKIVLLGASGQLGQEWQHFLNEEKAGDIDLLSYNSSQLNITKDEEVRDELEKQQPDAVVNCAAFTHVDGAEDQQELARKVNVEAAGNLARLSDELGFKLIHYSTDYVFPGKKEDRKDWPEGYRENHPAEPINYYGQTKWEGEQAIRSATDNYLILRVSWLCGQFGSNFVKTMLRLGKERDKLQVVNDQWGSPSFAENVVENSFNLMKADQRGIYHITSKGLISWYDFASAIFSMGGVNVDVEPVPSEAFPTKAKRPHFSKLSTAKIKEVPGSKIVGWQEGLKHLLEQLLH
ncbi:MAG TPA: dTDP-4-dehydrorhamnose reductase [Balneolaceae bacterium]|nr:dTDP-4-dehydrorhamnose reductase [Balneolaceae bacterium]